jgi:hypothetical protein
MFGKGRIGLALALIGLVTCRALAAEPEFDHLAEGFTSAGTEEGIVAAQRMFSAPDFPEICPSLPAPARLAVVAPNPLRLVRGQWFTYDRLVVVAVDDSGTILPPVPITIEIEPVEPPVLALGHYMTGDPDGQVLPVRAGAFHFRFRTICEGHSAVVVVPVEVTEP